METLLRNKFTNHYGLQNCTTAVISKQTNEKYFELKDDNTIIYYNDNEGIARYNNPYNKVITVINYECFIGQFNNHFRRGRKVCDLLVMSKNKEFFILNELTNTDVKFVEPHINTKGVQVGKRAHAKEQLKQTLTDLLEVLDISDEIHQYMTKRCCFFNKVSMAPVPIDAVTTFDKVNLVVKNGFKMSEEKIESLGFEYYEFSGNQSFNLL